MHATAATKYPGITTIKRRGEDRLSKGSGCRMKNVWMLDGGDSVIAYPCDLLIYYHNSFLSQVRINEEIVREGIYMTKNRIKL